MSDRSCVWAKVIQGFNHVTPYHLYMNQSCKFIGSFLYLKINISDKQFIQLHSAHDLLCSIQRRKKNTYLCPHLCEKLVCDIPEQHHGSLLPDGIYIAHLYHEMVCSVHLPLCSDLRVYSSNSCSIFGQVPGFVFGKTRSTLQHL